MSRGACPWRFLGMAMAALGALTLGGCAPRPGPSPDVSGVDPIARYRVSLAARESRSMAVESDVALWVRLADRRALPGAQGSLVLSAPDAFRLRVGSAFGTAFDLAARGDSVTLYVPARRAFAEVDVAADSLGLPDPGALVLRIWCGTWRVPEGAFASSEWDGARRVARWSEGGDRRVLAVDPDGLPAWVLVSRPGGEMRVDYVEWGGWDGVRWPARIEIGDPAGRFHVTCRVQRVQFFGRPDRRRLMVRPPENAERLVWAEFRRAIDRIPRF